jgi:hypothetical protein
LARKSDGEAPKTFFQMDRFVQMNGQWFYMTREGEERGPFDSRSEAEGDLIDYIRHLNHMESYGFKK